MLPGRQGGPSHGVILAVVVGVVVLAPFLFGDQGEAIAELLSPLGFLFLPVTLLLTIQFLSSDRGAIISSIFSTGELDTIHGVSGPPVRLVVFLLLTLFLLYSRVSIFGGGDDSDE